MTSLLNGLKAEWNCVAYETPGRRFINYYRRAQREPSTAKTAARIAVGTILLAGGVVLWFTPGPGWLFVIFGLAMFAAQSRPLARFLDRTEMAIRARLKSIFSRKRRR